LNLKQKNIIRIVLISLGVLILLAGIAVFIIVKTFRKPEILATDSIITFTDDGQVFGHTTIKIRNNNNYSIRIDSLNYSMIIKGKTYLNGIIEDVLILNSKQDTSLVLSYHINADALEKDFKNYDSIAGNFKVHGYLSVFGFKKIPVRFSAPKTIPIFKKPILTGDQNYLKLGSDGFLRATLVLEVQNPNKYQIILDSITYSLFIEGQKYMYGQRIKSLTLNPASTQKISLPLAFNYNKYVKNFTGRDSTLYKFEFECLISTLSFKQEHVVIPFEKKLPLVTKFNIAVDHMKIQKINFKTADLLVYLKIGNPNSVGFKADHFHYRLWVENLQWAEGDYSKSLTLRKKSTLDLELPIELDLKKLGKSAGDYLKGDKVQNYKAEVEFNLTADMKTLQKVQMSMQSEGVLHLGKALKK
jgi:LEA14-like dessication related protein